MNDYPGWVDFVAWLGLDPVTVWFEYRVVFLVILAITAIAILIGTYFMVRALREYMAQAKYSFSKKFAFYRNLDELDWDMGAAAAPALEGRQLVYAVPALAMEDVAGFRSALGILILTERTLIFAATRGDLGKVAEFPLDSFRDANIKDGVKYVTLKLIQADKKPTFQMLGISREHAQELFMKMHSFRMALREQTATQAKAENEPE